MELPSQSTSVRLSISEASRLFGISEKTIRRAIKEGDIRYSVIRGRYKLQFDSVLTWSQRSSILSRRRDEAGIGQWVGQWKIRNRLYSPRAPKDPQERDEVVGTDVPTTSQDNGPPAA